MGQRETVMSWTYNNEVVEELPADCEGFVYLITNLTNNKKYIGKKLARFKTTKPPLKGRKNKRRGTKESDWQNLLGFVRSFKCRRTNTWRKINFTREILHFCPSRGVLSYMEAKEQFDRRVLETDEYYNGIINVRIGSSKILTEHLKKG